jgi:LCP family protein required for cell wall assembly
MNGPTLLLTSVEDLIGEPVDHYAMVDLAGFQEVVDRVGGYEICLERPVRDLRADLDLPAGCTLADGAETLAWLRSRHTQELTDNGWRTLPGVNDLMRNQRQRDFLIEMMGRLSDFSSPGALTSAAGALAPYVTVDDQLSLTDAVSLAWIMRGLGLGQITQLEVPVVDHVTDDGSAVLLPATPVEDLVAGFLSGNPIAEAPGVDLHQVRT